MKEQETSRSLLSQFAENLAKIPDHIIEGALNAMEDEDGKLVIRAYSRAFKNQFESLSQIMLEQEKKLTKENFRKVEELISVTAGLDLLSEIGPLTKNLGTNTAKIGLVGIIQMIKKIVKWILANIIKNLPIWMNDLLDLIDEILNEFFGIASPKLADILSQKEQNYLSELTKLAILNREERYLFNNTEDSEA